MALRAASTACLRPARAATLSRPRLIQAQDRHFRRTKEDLAEFVHPAASLFVRSDPGLAKLIELIDNCQLNLKL